jgi:coenzyme A diphosphatase NUDT7
MIGYLKLKAVIDMKKKSLIETIAKYHPDLATETEASAAVLLMLARDDNDKIFLVLTKRPDTIATYAGDFCFPGGMKDSNETDLKKTVVREVEEELNITPDLYQFIGQLDDFFDRFNHLVRPYVATIARNDFEKHLQISASEIEEVYFLPLEDLRKMEVNPTLEELTGRHPSYSYSHDNIFVWGLTATLMVHFANVIYNLKKPVARHR